MKDKELQQYIFENNKGKNDHQSISENDAEIYKAIANALDKRPEIEIPEYFSMNVVMQLQQKENLRLGIKRAIITSLMAVLLIGIAFVSLFLLDFNIVVQDFILLFKHNYVLVGFIILMLGAVQIIDKILLIRTLKIYPF